MSKNRDRIEWIDIAKGIGIILVVFGHVWRKNIPQNWLYSFHMPLFFFISGWLVDLENLKKIRWIEFITKKALTLLVPYILFVILTYLYWIIVESHFRAFDKGPLWFLLALLGVEIIAKAVSFLLKNRLWRHLLFLFVLVAFVLAGLSSQEIQGGMGWIIRIINGTFWYLLGIQVSVLTKQNFEDISSKLLIPAGGILLIASFIAGCKNGRVDMYLNRFNNIYLYIISAVLGIALCFVVSKVISNNKILEFYGRYSILILCTHEPIKRAVIQIYCIIFQTDTESFRNGIITGTLIVITVMLIEIIVIYIFKKIKIYTLDTPLRWLFIYIN